MRAQHGCQLLPDQSKALEQILSFARLNSRFDRAVNVTLGLPFVRTSPDHGTAFDIAGTGRADPSSLVAALILAARLTATAPALAPAK